MVSRMTEAREAAGLSKRALAQFIGSSPQTIARIEDGASPSLELASKIASALGTTPYRLFGRSTPSDEVDTTPALLKIDLSTIERTFRVTHSTSSLVELRIDENPLFITFYTEDHFVAFNASRLCGIALLSSNSPMYSVHSVSKLDDQNVEVYTNGSQSPRTIIVNEDDPLLTSAVYDMSNNPHLSQITISDEDGWAYIYLLENIDLITVPRALIGDVEQFGDYND